MRRFVPVTMGSPRFTTREVDGLWVTDAWFPPLTTLTPHVHERSIVATMLEGSFDLSFRGRTCECQPSTVFTEPAGERHANRMQKAGAHVLVLQPDPARSELFRPCATLLDRVNHARDEGVAALAWRLARELRYPDGVSSLAMEGLSLELLAVAARLRETARAERRPPAWLRRAHDLLGSSLATPPTIRDLAREAGVHPVHLARSFRAQYGLPIGAYLRRLRLEAAAAELARPDRTICEIALELGFADQSHFTRAFKRYSGLTPGRYRANLRQRKPAITDPPED